MSEKIEIKTARILRKRQTKSESLLWNILRARRFEGKKFLRQHPILYKLGDVQRFFVADFYCAEYRLVVELDGKVHDNQKEYDELRDSIISSKNIKVIRFKNEELENNLDLVLEKIKAYIQ